MKIDQISDIHLDNNLTYIAEFENKNQKKYGMNRYIYETSEYTFLTLFSHIIPEEKGEVLIIAGDLAEDISLMEKFFEYLNKYHYYEKIFYVFGNHELQFTSKEYHEFPRMKTYKDKVERIKRCLSKFKNLSILDGDVEEFKGIVFGGAMGWYDGAYSRYIDSSMTNKDITSQWYESSPDAAIEGIDYFDVPLQDEMIKIESIYKKVHVMITHISPLMDYRTINNLYKYSAMSGLYIFDGKKYFSNNIKYWAYGHIHDFNHFENGGITFVRNPLGFNNSFRKKYFSFEI